ncbi:Transcription factor GTE1 [Dichanthelium oligosanthes]|uniref:Transcription factor GTE1 n=1 Tax=Dichanthelium oligosanthes TaxID=888268 RepID=A0A1E5WFH6_9POAL|nr:Transcription factor GTE1 [Dichanthelium oligosanthes]
MTPANGAAAPEAVAEAALPHEVESEADAFQRQVDDLVSKTDVLERRVSEVVDFYDSKKHGSGGRKGGGGGRHGAYGRGMPDLMRQFGVILREITADKNTAWPFMKPVDPVEMEVPDYYNEKRQMEEESKGVVVTNTSREAAIAKLAKDTDDELNQINKQLEELRKMVVHRCRKMTTDEKRKLGAGLCHLSPDDLNKALEIVAQDNPSFQTKAEEVDLDMDAQSETTLWRLKFFVREALERQANVASGRMDENAKRKREICNALAKTASKRIKKQP